VNLFPSQLSSNPLTYSTLFVSAMDHHRTEPAFATGSNLVQLWDETKSAPVSNLTFAGSTETIESLRFNASESSVLATAGSDRALTIYDVRTGKAERRVIMQVGLFFPTSRTKFQLWFYSSARIHSHGHRRSRHPFSWRRRTTISTRLIYGIWRRQHRFTRGTYLL